MEIKLLRLGLKNFKGIKEFDFEPNGQSATIYGRNGAGKSTVADSLNWLLFDKNQAGDKAFSVKTLDEAGLELHNLEHEVEAVLEIEMSKDLFTGVMLRKLLVEKWTKKRGSQSLEFTGHETTYYIDDVPKKKQEFDAYVSGLVREDLFRMLTGITHFNAMKWQDRRRLLLEVAGDVTDASVIDAHGDKFTELPGIMCGRTFDDTMKMFKAQRPKINDELDKIPSRIDEAQRSKPGDAACLPPQGIPAYDELTAKLRNLQNGRAAMQAGDTSHIQAEINTKQSEISRLATEHRGKVMDAEDRRRKLTQEVALITPKVTELEFSIKAKESENVRLGEAVTAGRIDYQALAARKKEGRTCCPTCEQELPADNSRAAELRHKIEGNLDKAIADNIATGKANKAKIEENLRVMAGAQEEIQRLEHVRDSKQAEADSVTIPEGPDMAKLNAELEEIKAKLNSQSTPDTAKIDEEIEIVRSQIKQHDDAAANNKVAANIEVRVKELKADQKRLGQEIDELDRKLMLCEDFIRAKVKMLEGSVSAKFAPLSFKLFDEQINGGLAETCETLVPSPAGAMVPWSDANTGARILAGLKIIEVLGIHYGITAPVFVDNAESLTSRYPEIDSQIISLVAVDEGDYDGLRVVVREISTTF
jgi:energy-coupling factor transporter ATP-binding protein EcfA2